MDGMLSISRFLLKLESVQDTGYLILGMTVVQKNVFQY
jgi:hypothetical protein